MTSAALIAALLTSSALAAWFASRSSLADSMTGGSPTGGSATDIPLAATADQDNTGGAIEEAAQGTSTRASIAVVADVADLLALAVESGQGLREALAAVAEVVDDPARGHLRSVVAAMGWGFDPKQAWSTVPQPWQSVASALTVADLAGIPPAEALRHAAGDVRARLDHELSVAAARLGVRLVLPLGLTFLPAFVCTTIVPVVIGLAGSLVGPA